MSPKAAKKTAPAVKREKTFRQSTKLVDPKGNELVITAGETSKDHRFYSAVSHGVADGKGKFERKRAMKLFADDKDAAVARAEKLIADATALGWAKKPGRQSKEPAFTSLPAPAKK